MENKFKASEEELGMKMKELTQIKGICQELAEKVDLASKREDEFLQTIEAKDVEIKEQIEKADELVKKIADTKTKMNEEKDKVLAEKEA